jgi:hypothetical protein
MNIFSSYAQRFAMGFLFFSAFNMLQAQNINFTSFPKSLQLFPREVRTNQANIVCAGSALRVSGYTKLKLKVLRENVLQTEQEQILTFNAAGTAAFSFQYTLLAELANYSFQILGINATGLETEIRRAEKVVAGDVYIINGQSNAQAYVAAMPEDFDEFSRSYVLGSGFGTGWVAVQYSNAGHWAGHFAKRAVRELGIPVATFNGSEGGQAIKYYLKSDTSLRPVNNYFALKNRLDSAGIRGRGVRAAFWFHGETDGWETSVEDYSSRFSNLHAAWKADYGIEQSYIFQVRWRSCTHPSPRVFEAQRQLARKNNDIFTISTLNADHDGCHFAYQNGYRVLGERLYRLVAKNLYQRPLLRTASPDVERAYWNDSTTIVVRFKTDTIKAIGFPWLDFRLEGNTENAQIQTGRAVGNEIFIKVTPSRVRPKGITYLSRPGNEPHWLVDAQGLGVLTFFNETIDTVLRTDTNQVSTPQKQGLRLYPSPNDGQFWVDKPAEFAQISTEISLEILNFAGVCVFKEKRNVPATENRLFLDLPMALSRGAFILKLQSANSKPYFARFQMVN